MAQSADQAPDEGRFARAELPLEMQYQPLGRTGRQGFAQPERCGLIGQTNKL